MHAIPVRHIMRNQVDVAKWDHCIDLAPNGLPYVYSYFLDHMSPEWSALVAGDYELVMPLTWKRKWGISYLTQPPFVQQGGIFGSGDMSAEQLNSFLLAAKTKFRFAEIFLNHLNDLDQLNNMDRPNDPDHPNAPNPPNVANHASAGSSRQNFLLDLHASYETIRQSYKTVLLKNLKVASRQQLAYSVGNVQQSIDMYRQEYTGRLPHVKAAAYKAFEQICTLAAAKGNLVARSSVSASGEILSSVILIKDARRLVLLISVTNAAGRKVQANHFLLDKLIREFAGQSLLLDFEGSDVPGIASFYQSFGAFNQPYFFYRHNHLPKLVKLLKP